MPRRRKPSARKCTVPGCGQPHGAKGFCIRHYKQKHRLEGPRCSIRGCDRKVAARGLCTQHNIDPTRVIRPVVAAEARRRQLGPSGMMSEVIDQWAKALKSGAWPRNSLAPCAFPGCPRPLYFRGLCRTHHWQRQHGKELTPIRAIGPADGSAEFGHLRLTPELAKRLRRAAASRGVPVAELVRQVLEAGLP